MGSRYNLDEYTRIASPIHRWEPRTKIVGLFILIFAFAFIKHFFLLPLMVLTVAILYKTSRLPLAYLWHRLQYPGYFIVGVVVFLPFCSGTTVLHEWGPIALRQEGLAAMALVVSRFLAILITGFVLLGSTPFLAAISALRSLGLPPVLTDMTLLAYRYLYDIADRLATMQQSMRLRGFGYADPTLPRRSRLHRVPHLALLAGTLLLRSYEQSERVYKAMRLRGYGQTPQAPTGALQLLSPATVDQGSWVAMISVIALAAAFVLAEWMLSSS